MTVIAPNPMFAAKTGQRQRRRNSSVNPGNLDMRLIPSACANLLRLQFRLATLFVVVGALCISLAVWASRERAFQAQRTAVERAL